jgi:hypothetical protein
MGMSNKRISQIGQTFGRLTAISDAEDMNGKSASICQCECGTVKSYRNGSLTSGNTLSCGCLHNDLLSERLMKHGMLDSQIYGVWIGMKDRCCNPNSERYADYGGRGITVCDRWVSSFNNFFADMGDIPFKGAQIDRKENDKGYSPDNCKWSTRNEQARNKRNNRILVFNGVGRCLTEWAEITGIKTGTLISRLKRGWQIERALTEGSTH